MHVGRCCRTLRHAVHTAAHVRPLWDLPPSLTYGCYAVASLPSASEGSALTSSKIKRLLVNVQKFMNDVSKTPTSGVSGDEFRAKLVAIVRAERSAVAAARARERSLHEFIELVTHSHGRVLGHYLDDLVMSFSDLM